MESSTAGAFLFAASSELIENAQSDPAGHCRPPLPVRHGRTTHSDEPRELALTQSKVIAQLLHRLWRPFHAREGRPGVRNRTNRDRRPAHHSVHSIVYGKVRHGRGNVKMSGRTHAVTKELETAYPYRLLCTVPYTYLCPCSHDQRTA